MTAFRRAFGLWSTRLARAATLGAALAAPHLRAAEAPSGNLSTQLGPQLQQVRGQLKNAGENLQFVERQYTERPEPGQDESKLRRFSEGEIQYLLGSYDTASVLFYDLVSDADFKRHEKYADALYYLAESLYQQKNLVGARLYLRELLALGSARQQEALVRFIEVAGRTNDFSGIDPLIERSRSATGTLPPEVAYVYGKWAFRRSDLTPEAQMQRAQEALRPLIDQPDSPYRLQAAYFLAVGHVQLKAYDAAIEAFRQLAAETPKTPREQKIQVLANLSLGRLLYETGKYDEAIDRYQEIPRESDEFVDSLYEIAWAHVRKGDHNRAKNATELLLLVADPNAPLKPLADILYGHLQLKLSRFDEATALYEKVINEYAPVEEEIAATLELAGNDPVKYFNERVAVDRAFDVTALLPPVAMRWATTERDVTDAIRLLADLDASRRGVQEAEAIAERIRKAVDERGLEVFPTLQDGYSRADAVDSAVTQIMESLVRAEGVLAAPVATGAERAQLDKLAASVSALKRRFDALPKSQRAVEDRQARLQKRLDELDKEAFRMGLDVQSLFASLTAIEKWVLDTRAQRQDTAEDEKAFAERLRSESAALTAMESELRELRQQLVSEKSAGRAVSSGEEEIRRQYAQALEQQHALFQQLAARLPPGSAQWSRDIADLREQADQLGVRVANAKRILREKLAAKIQVVLDTVRAERALLAEYGGSVRDVSGSARGLVGQVVVHSFKKVKRQFYDLVLKSNVGIVDVAFTRKQDKTAQIQKLAAQKDRDLRALDEEFKEVLKDDD